MYKANFESTEAILYEDINLMLSFCSVKGIEIPLDVPKLIKENNLNDLIEAHNILSNIIKPVTPQSIKCLDGYYLDESRGFGNKLNFPRIKYLLIITGFALFSLCAASLSPLVNDGVLKKGLLEASGIPLLLNLIFIISASTLGTLFSLLKKIEKSVKEMTLFPHDSFNLWSSIIIGSTSGFILSEIVPTPDNLFNNIEATKMLLALLGGFSSEVVYNILQSLLKKIESFFGNEDN